MASWVDGRGVSKAHQSAPYTNTGTFGAFRKPELVGVSDTVRLSNADLARRASREMRRFKRTLPKGVKV